MVAAAAVTDAEQRIYSISPLHGLVPPRCMKTPIQVIGANLVHQNRRDFCMMGTSDLRVTAAITFLKPIDLTEDGA